MSKNKKIYSPHLFDWNEIEISEDRFMILKNGNYLEIKKY
jgi:hypothetical protein